MAVQQSVSVSGLIDAEQQNKSNKQEHEIKKGPFSLKAKQTGSGKPEICLI